MAVPGIEPCPKCGESNAFIMRDARSTRRCGAFGCNHAWYPKPEPGQAAPECANCRFSRSTRFVVEDLRECRRHAPTSPNWWPTVRTDAWCGEYQRQEG